MKTPFALIGVPDYVRNSVSSIFIVIPAKAGIYSWHAQPLRFWMPAFAGMTGNC
jgi:hypothetical protein